MRGEGRGRGGGGEERRGKREGRRGGGREGEREQEGGEDGGREEPGEARHPAEGLDVQKDDDDDDDEERRRRQLRPALKEQGGARHPAEGLDVHRNTKKPAHRPFPNIQLTQSQGAAGTRRIRANRAPRTCCCLDRTSLDTKRPGTQTALQTCCWDPPPYSHRKIGRPRALPGPRANFEHAQP